MNRASRVDPSVEPGVEPERASGLRTRLRIPLDAAWAMVPAVFRLRRNLDRIASDSARVRTAEQALRENEKRFYHAVRGSRDAIWDWDLANERYYMSPRMKEILGYGYGEPITERNWFLEHLHLDDRARVDAARLAHFDNGAAYEIEYRMRAADGSFRWIRARGESVRDAQGGVVRFSGANSDITAESEAAERIRVLLGELRREKEFSEALLAAQPGVFCVLGKSGRLLRWNRNLETVSGYDADALAAIDAPEIIAPEHRRKLAEEVYRVFKHGAASVEADLVTRSGERMPQLWTAARWEAGGETYMVACAVDISEIKQVESALRRSEERYRAFIAQSQEAIWRFEQAEPVPTHLPVDEQIERILDSARLAECNLEHARIYGFASEQEALGMPIETFGGRETNRALVREFVRGGYRIASKEWCETLNGEERWFRGSVVGVVENGCLVRAWGTQSEITAHKRAEQQAQEQIRALNQQLELRVAERTAELTRANRELESFSYTVSHDLSAPLRAINGFSALLVEELGGKLEPSAQRLLERIADGSLQMKALIDDLLSLAQISRTRLVAREVDLAALARRVAEECAQDHPGRSVEFRVAPTLPAHGDLGLLGIALTNLIGNAWKFTARSARAQVEFGATAQGGESVYYLRDNGAGFDMRYAGKLFKPFQRLHSAREFGGTGIGLAIVHRIFERHGGRVWVESAPGAGTTFYFTLG